MTGSEILLLADFLISGAERGAALLAQARREGLITAEEQQARIDRVKVIGTRVGVEVIDPPGPPTG